MFQMSLTGVLDMGFGRAACESVVQLLSLGMDTRANG
jgi:hypothetical protein